MIEPPYLEELLRINGLTRESGPEKVKQSLAALGWSETEMTQALGYYFENKIPGQKEFSGPSGTIVSEGNMPLSPTLKRPVYDAPHVSHGQYWGIFFIGVLVVAAFFAIYYQDTVLVYVNSFLSTVKSFR